MKLIEQFSKYGLRDYNYTHTLTPHPQLNLNRDVKKNSIQNKGQRNRPPQNKTASG